MLDAFQLFFLDNHSRLITTVGKTRPAGNTFRTHCVGLHVDGFSFVNELEGMRPAAVANGQASTYLMHMTNTYHKIFQTFASIQR